MAEKSRIIATLGEQSLLLPTLVNAALAANDRAKYYFTLLQTARLAADRPGAARGNLKPERIASGVADTALDAAVAATSRIAEGRYRIPEAQRIVDALFAEVRTMFEPLAGDEGIALTRRLDALAKDAFPGEDGSISGEQIDAMVRADRGRGDSFHLVVMDAHKALNRLQATIASETIDGAAVYQVAPEDRERVRAFMRGVNSTAMLKFDHPGLATTATRSEGRLVLQNDIGTTDAHVLVIHVIDRTVTVTYTDVHLQRLLFFQSLFESHAVEWRDTVSRKDDQLEDGVYHLAIGRYAAADEAALDGFLAFLGSRLVFLIDWNRARKRLRAFVPKDKAVQLLKWAAENGYGHMAFLKAGGEQLVYDALELAGRGQVRLGTRLSEMLGVREAVEYLRFVLRSCAEGLLRGEPESFVQDAVRAELLNHFRTGRQRLFDIAVEHAAYVVEIASGVRDAVLSGRLADAGNGLERNARRAKEWETRADELVNRARAAAHHADSGEFFRGLLETADDIADELEEAAFHLALLPAGPASGDILGPLRPLAELAVQSAQEYLKALETARHVRRGGVREDMEDFLEAIHRIIALERRSDDAERQVERALATMVGDFRGLHIFAETAKNLEEAADALMRCGLHMRDHVLAQATAA